MLYDVSVLEGIMKFTDIRADIGRPVSYYPALADACGGAKAAILLCQLVYWINKQHDPDGWIYKVASDLKRETGLNWEEQKTARKHLLRRGLILERYDRENHRMWFKVDIRKVAELDLELSGKVQMPLHEKAQEVAGNPVEAIRESPIRYSETTTETTLENTKPETQPDRLPARKNGSRVDDFLEGFELLKEAGKAIRKVS